MAFFAGRKGVSHPMAVLTEGDITELRLAVLFGEKQEAVARKFGVSQGHVSDICRKRMWPHLPFPYYRRERGEKVFCCRCRAEMIVICKEKEEIFYSCPRCNYQDRK